MYVLVRDDLTPGQQLAQAVHAAVEHTLKHHETVGRTPTVVVLAVPDEASLRRYASGGGTLFYEPDLESYTAMCDIGDGSRFSTLRLAGAVMV